MWGWHGTSLPHSSPTCLSIPGTVSAWLQSSLVGSELHLPENKKQQSLMLAVNDEGFLQLS